MAEEPQRVEIVRLGSEFANLVTQLTTLLEHLNRFFSLSLTSGGRVKVANIPIQVGDAAESQQNVVSSIIRIPALLEGLIAEVRQTREVLSRLADQQTGSTRQGT